jgi:ribosomal protein L15
VTLAGLRATKGARAAIEAAGGKVEEPSTAKESEVKGKAAGKGKPAGKGKA